MFVIGALMQIVGTVVGIYMAVAIGLGASDRIPVERYDILIVGGSAAFAVYVLGQWLERMAKTRRMGGKVCV